MIYEYKSELWKGSISWVSDKPKTKDVEKMDEFINAWASEGWELVSNSFLTNPFSATKATLLTFRRERTAF